MSELYKFLAKEIVFKTLTLLGGLGSAALVVDYAFANHLVQRKIVKANLAKSMIPHPRLEIKVFIYNNSILLHVVFVLVLSSYSFAMSLNPLELNQS